MENETKAASSKNFDAEHFFLNLSPIILEFLFANIIWQRVSFLSKILNKTR